MIRTLNDLGPSEVGRIIHVGGGSGIRRRLIDMGVVTGALVEVQRVAPLGDPVEVRVKGYDLALRKEEASHIKIEVTRGWLSGVPSGETVAIVALKAGFGLQRRLADLGLTPGTEVRVVNSGRPGPVVLEIRGSRLALGQGVAGKIMVRPAGVETND